MLIFVALLNYYISTLLLYCFNYLTLLPLAIYNMD